MSVSLPFGFRFPHGDLAKAWTAIRAFQLGLRPRADARLTERLAAAVAEELDRRTLGLPATSPEAAPLAAVWRNVDATLALPWERRGYEPQWDLRFTLTLFPTGDGLMGLVHTAQHDWAERWLATPGLERFPYWDNTDGPAELSHTAWRARGAMWHRALTVGSQRVPPVQAGLSAELVPTRLPHPRARDIVAALPALAARVATQTRDLVLTERLRVTVPEGSAPHQYMDGFLEATVWLATPEAHAAERRVEARVWATLLPNPGVKDLLGFVPRDWETSDA